MKVQYRSASNQAVDTTLHKAVLAEVASSLPVREFRWYKGQRHYPGWYWVIHDEWAVAHESRLELARIVLADFTRP